MSALFHDRLADWSSVVTCDLDLDSEELELVSSKD
jgi:hypothetical protein